jgi:hypothetical protein
MLRVVDCDDREDGIMSSELPPDTLAAWMEYSRTMSSVLKVLAYQQKRVHDATASLIDRLGVVDNQVAPLPELPDFALPLPAFLDALAMAVVESSQPAEPDGVPDSSQPAEPAVVPLHAPMSSSLPIPYPEPLSPTAPLLLSPISDVIGAELLDEEARLQASQSSVGYVSGDFLTITESMILGITLLSAPSAAQPRRVMMVAAFLIGTRSGCGLMPWVFQPMQLLTVVRCLVSCPV